MLNISRVSDTASLSSRIYDQLKSAITSINIYDDDVDLRLDERTLSEQFGSSRTPLREALTRLDQEGLVNIRSRRGVYIVRKSKAEVLETITVWAALESMAARLACTAASDAELGELNQMVESFSADTVQDHMTEYSDANIRFHGSIIRLSKCDLIAQMTDSLFIHVRAIRHRTIFEKDRGERSVEDHREIVDALQKREQDEASRLVREHAMKLHEHVRLYVDLD